MLSTENASSRQVVFNYRKNTDMGKSPNTDPLLIPTTSRISVTIIDIKQLYIHELLVI